MEMKVPPSLLYHSKLLMLYQYTKHKVSNMTL